MGILALRAAFVFNIDDCLLGHGDALPRYLEAKWLVALQSIGQPSQFGDEIFFRINLFDVTLARCFGICQFNIFLL